MATTLLLSSTSNYSFNTLAPLQPGWTSTSSYQKYMLVDASPGSYGYRSSTIPIGDWTHLHSRYLYQLPMTGLLDGTANITTEWFVNSSADGFYCVRMQVFRNGQLVGTPYSDIAPVGTRSLDFRFEPFFWTYPSYSAYTLEPMNVEAGDYFVLEMGCAISTSAANSMWHAVGTSGSDLSLTTSLTNLPPPLPALQNYHIKSGGIVTHKPLITGAKARYIMHDNALLQIQAAGDTPVDPDPPVTAPTWTDDFQTSQTLETNYLAALLLKTSLGNAASGLANFGSAEGTAYALREFGAHNIDLTVECVGTTQIRRGWRLIAHADSAELPGVPVSGYMLAIDNDSTPRVKLSRNGVGVDTADFTGFGSAFKMRLRVKDGLVQGRLWDASGAEPATWDVEYTDSSPLAPGVSGFGVRNSGNRATQMRGPFIMSEAT